MRTFKTEGIVIKRRNFGESDRILTIFTKDMGKIVVRATGVRKITSRRSAHVELLNHARLSLYHGKTWPILIEAQVLDNFPSIKSDFHCIGHAYHLCELLDRLCPENQDQRALFRLFYRTLQQLSQDKDITSIIRSFEKELLEELGYWDNEQILPDNSLHTYIETIIERKLKSHSVFSKLRE